MLTDAGTLPAAVDFTTALGQLENAIGQTNTVGYIHAAPALASAASRSSQLVRHPDGTLDDASGEHLGFRRRLRLHAWHDHDCYQCALWLAQRAPVANDR